jgi:hypothetical protein
MSACAQAQSGHGGLFGWRLLLDRDNGFDVDFRPYQSAPLNL